MKRTCLLACTVALVTLCSCTVKEQRLGYDDATGGVVLTALTDMPGVRTGVVDGGTEVFWESQEEIKVFAGTSSAKFVSANTDLASKADFIGPSDFSVAPGKPVVAVYPYSDDVAYDGECITMTLPSEQVACPGTFARGTNIAVAKSDTHTLQFRNVCGGLRFSVKEEGITKVIFEGLGGEIISGKVQVAVDDAGLPAVKEIVDGSQRIQLVAPNGQTFKVGEWYYIVVLPGTLERGYKIRFYKDVAYARKVSERMVSVKRSLFASFDSADNGLNYSAPSETMPSSDDEIDRSFDMMGDISFEAENILSMYEDALSDGTADREAIAEEIATIDNVVSATLNEDGSAVFVTQSDGMCVNVLLDIKEYPKGASSDSGFSFPATKSTISSGGFVSPNGKRALILAPFQWSFNEDLDYVVLCLEWAGFQVDIFKNSLADLSKFNGNFLSVYDVILITTHGSSHFISADGTTSYKASIASGTLASSWKDYKDVFDLDKVVVCSKGVDYLAVHDKVLEGHDFSDAYVLLSACRASSFAYSFIENGAEYAIGYKESILVPLANTYDCWTFYYLCNRFSAEDARTQLRSYLTEEDITWLNKYEAIYSKSGAPYFLIDPVPKNLMSTIVSNSQVKLSWELPYPHSFSNMEVYVDGIAYSSGFQESSGGVYSLYYTPVASGESSWYVKVSYGGGDSFKSSTNTFTVKPNLTYKTTTVDLGLSVDWCTCNLGAASPENFGGYWAWGETDTKTEYSWSTYKYCNGTEKTLTKYVNDSSYGYNGFVDNKGILESEDDAATKNLGSKFHTPTCAEWCELLENTTHTWTNNFNGTGVSGYIMMSTVPGYTGKYIFLPAAGYQWYTNVGVGNYMTSEQQNTLPSCFDTAYLAPNEIYAAGYDRKCSTGSREEGHSIRPVFGDVVSQPTISISPASLNFGEVAVGSSRGNEAGRVTMTNTGSSNLVISSFDCPSGFSHSPNLALPHTIAPGDSWTVTFAFRPTSAKQYSGYISINSNASNGSVKQVKVAGTGI